MGDSSGANFGYQQSAPDIRAAIDALMADQPQLREIVLFGECEAASGILFYAYQDQRVKGLVLVNPWVRTEEGHAEVMVKHYYLQRVLSAAFWRKVLSGSFRAGESLRSFFQMFRAYLGVRRIRALSETGSGPEPLGDLPLPAKTAAGLRRFGGAVMILMSGNDYIAREFDEIARSTKAWQGLLDQPRITRHVLNEADHTFSREIWKLDATERITRWLHSW
jgi:exosortase A-associated hydrolase 1